MWKRRSYVLAPLTKLMKLNRKKNFLGGKYSKMPLIILKISKKLISNEVIFAYPDFTKGFDIHVDANDT